MTHTELMALADTYGRNCFSDGAHDVCVEHPKTLQARAALSDALKQVVQDAERYRFLTTKGNDDADYIGESWQDCYATWNGQDGIVGFEKVIDAAMKEKP